MSRATGYTAQDILRLLDERAARFDFPVLDNGYIYPGDVRLTAYRDERRWAVLIEHLGYHYKLGFPGGVYSSVYAFGNAVRDERQRRPRAFDCVFDRDREFHGDVPPDQKEVLVRGKPVAIPRKKSAYAAKGIQVRDVKELWGQHVLRFLLPEHREALLLTEDDLRQRVAADLPLFLRLNAWHHPDISNEETPSANETFQQLAEALAEGDPNRMVLTREPNTHWKNWPMGGQL
jgi:hypothetical protein